MEAETLFTTSELTLDSLSMTKIQLYCAISFILDLPWCHEIRQAPSALSTWHPLHLFWILLCTKAIPPTHSWKVYQGLW